METETKEMKKNVCSHGDHCCGCNTGAMGVCTRHGGMRWFALVVAIILSFWIGMKLGEIKGFMKAQGYGMHMRGDWKDQGMQHGTMLHEDERPADMPLPDPSELPAL